MLYWMQLLHFYQPPTQSHEVLAKICDECYRPLLQVFRDYPHAKVTINICGVLTEMLAEHGHKDIIETLKKLADNGQIEFTGTGKYHPILPLIPESEAERQIMSNMSTNRQFLGDSFSPQGFFPPELCYSRDIIEPILNSGHRWLILSGVACPVNWPVDVVHEVNFGVKRLAIIFRDDILSNKVSFKSINSYEFLAHLRRLGKEKRDNYVVTAMDAETFGHHIKNWEREFLARVFEGMEPNDAQNAKIASAGDLLRIFPRGQIIQPASSSWSTSKGDIEAGNPYPLWRGKGNEIHKLQWEHLNICLDMTNKALTQADNEESKNYASIARYYMDNALHSDQFWWANAKPRWDINLIYKGLQMQRNVLINAFKAISTSDTTPVEKRECYYRLTAVRELESKIVDKLLDIA